MITRSSHKLDIYQWKTIWDIWLNYRKTNQFFKFIVQMELYQHDTQVLSMNLVYIKYRSVDDLPHPVDVDHIDMIKTFGGKKQNAIWKRLEHFHSSRLSRYCAPIGGFHSSLMPWRTSSRHPKPPTRGISCLSLVLYDISQDPPYLSYPPPV